MYRSTAAICQRAWAIKMRQKSLAIRKCLLGAEQQKSVARSAFESFGQTVLQGRCQEAALSRPGSKASGPAE